MEYSSESLNEVIKEELMRLGVTSCNRPIINNLENKKSSLVQSGSKFLGFSNVNNNQCRDKDKPKFGPIDSPKLPDKCIDASKYTIQSASKTPSKYDNIKSRRNITKSPFSSKSRNERRSGRKKNVTNHINKSKKNLDEVFGRELDSISLCPTQLKDGTLVNIPEFIIDLSNLIRRNLSVEGIFRKAGSSQRQNDIKKLVNCGISLPQSVHPIDAACLLKQYLRSLPTSLLAQPVHTLLTNCLEIQNNEDRMRALGLCTMLLPKTHQHLLAYILELLSDVASASNCNMMDARNLGIVLAPNLLPAFNNLNSSKKTSWFNDDFLLTSTINVIESLIEGANDMCRLSDNISEAVQNKDRSQSLENLADAPPSCGSQKKKRRSASIHRLMNGLRRVVQGGGSLLSSQPSTLISSPVTATTPIPSADKGSAVNMHPDADHSAKRKSDTFESPHDKKSGTNLQHQDFDRPKKKPRMDLGAGVRWASSYNSLSPADKKDPNLVMLKTKHPKVIQSLVTVREDPQECVRRSYSLREKRVVLNSPTKCTELKSPTKVKRRKSCVGVSAAEKTPLKRIENRVMRPYPITVSPSTPSLSPLINHPNSSILLPLRPSTHLRRKVIRSKSMKEQYLSNCPDGSENSPLGLRGIPDGSECNIRDSSPSANYNSLFTLERQYDEVKHAVKTMEEEIDRDNILEIKGAFYPVQNGLEAANASCSQIIHSAYERMKMETRDLDSSPSDYLSRRLGKELKIRSRRSDEHRVMRSPSERKIGSIRRRSKELEQTALKNQGNCGDAATTSKLATPKYKGSLLQSPHSALKRGKPNSLKSGLPVVVKPANTIGLPGVADNSPTMGICITKRPPSKKTPNEDHETFYSSFSSTQNHQGTSYTSLNESIFGNFTDDYAGPVTRRRSSIMSTTSNPLPVLNLTSADDSFEASSRSFSSFDLNNENKCIAPPFELLEKENVNLNETYTKNISSSTRGDIDANEENMEWVPATTYMKNLSEMPQVISVPQGEPNGSRPSIAALMKQKKVTANVQLFSQLQGPNGMVTPTSMRRSTRHKRISNNHTPLRSVASERRCSRTRIPSERSRLTLTPMDARPSRSRVRLTNESKSPLSERNNVNQPAEFATPRIMSRETPSSKAKYLDSNILFSGLTPLPPRPFKPSVVPCITPRSQHLCNETPPRLPPRLPTNTSRRNTPHADKLQ